MPFAVMQESVAAEYQQRREAHRAEMLAKLEDARRRAAQQQRRVLKGSLGRRHAFNLPALYQQSHAEDRPSSRFPDAASTSDR
jgi:hypothetical protein